MKYIATLILIFSFTGVASAAEIVLHSDAQPKGHVVRLGDVAEVRAIDADRTHRLASIPLMPTPAPGTRQFVRMQQVREMLVAHGEDMAEHRLRGASQVQIGTNAPTVKTAVRTIPRRLTGSAVQKQHDKAIATIVEHLNVYASPNEPWQVAFELTDAQLRQLAKANTPVTVSGGEAPWVGLQRFTFRFTTPAGPVHFLVAANVTLPEPVVVAVHAIPSGSIIRAVDVEMRRVPRKPNRRGNGFEPIRQLDQVIGTEAKRAIRAGDMLYPLSIRLPILVRRGDAVTITACTGGVMVRTYARASENGSRGDLIVVESLETRERIAARVVGVCEVEVFAQSVDASAYATEPAVVSRPAPPKPKPVNDKELTAKRPTNGWSSAIRR